MICVLKLNVIASGAERCQTARMAMLLSVQLGTEFDLASTKPVLTAAMNDATIPIMERSMVFHLLTIPTHFTY